MRKLFIMALFIISICNAQQINTYKHLKEIENNKEKYINKPFEILLNDLLIFPNEIGEYPIKKNKLKNSIIEFFDKEDVVLLSVMWKGEVSNEYANYLKKKNMYKFTEEEYFYYKKLIIENIKVYKRK